MSGNLNEALRWLKQAEKDLTSAEKALKSFLYLKGFRKILTHSIFELIKEIGDLEIEFK